MVAVWKKRYGAAKPRVFHCLRRTYKGWPGKARDMPDMSSGQVKRRFRQDTHKTGIRLARVSDDRWRMAAEDHTCCKQLPNLLPSCSIVFEVEHHPCSISCVVFLV